MHFSNTFLLSIAIVSGISHTVTVSAIPHSSQASLNAPFSGINSNNLGGSTASILIDRGLEDSYGTVNLINTIAVGGKYNKQGVQHQARDKTPTSAQYGQIKIVLDDQEHQLLHEIQSRWPTVHNSLRSTAHFQQGQHVSPDQALWRQMNRILHLENVILALQFDAHGPTSIFYIKPCPSPLTLEVINLTRTTILQKWLEIYTHPGWRQPRRL
ncbi:hypothetical protein BC835DRAFT_1422107 [Cytidiella melzeri]|nr:hypothetical protein BC835DRAFT_1422107 [Cytidiella melzeri]